MIKTRYIKSLRVCLAIFFWAGLTLLLAGVALPLGWMAKIQLLPAILAGNVVVLAVLALLTILFGRIYCSVICPLGVLQDGISHIGAKTRKKKPFHFRKELAWLRNGVWTLTLVALLADIQLVVALIAPYSAYGRMVRSVVDPSWPLALIAGLSFVLIGTLAFFFGRQGWCNSVCPVGTTLGIFSRFAVFVPVIDKDKCKNCRACEHKCKASCIDIEDHSIDYSRCVSCYDCLGECKFDAIHFGNSWKRPGTSKSEEKTTDSGRRAFLAGTLVLAGTTAARAQKKVDGGFAAVLDKTSPERDVPLTPPGSKSIEDFYSRCTACQLCVSACPNGVLRPSTELERLMQPEMGYENGFCRPECTKCSELCPSGAILRISREEKTQYHIGTAKVERSLCVSQSGTHCGNCARHCPSGAIRMVKDEDEHQIPVVNEELCTGCGACEFLCPARPLSAITVNGRHSHIEV